MKRGRRRAGGEGERRRRGGDGRRGNGERVSRRTGEVRRRARETEILKVGDMVRLGFVFKVQEMVKLGGKGRGWVTAHDTVAETETKRGNETESGENGGQVR